MIAADGFEQCGLSCGFDAFGNHAQTQMPSHRDDRLYNHPVAWIVGDIDGSPPMPNVTISVGVTSRIIESGVEMADLTKAAGRGRVEKAGLIA